MERRPLVLTDGLHGYVEPDVLLRVGSDFLVAGHLSYTWGVGGSRVQMVSDGAHVAAYLSEDAPRLVESPITGVIGMVRAVALDGRRWAMLLSEVVPESAGAFPEVIHLWYAEYDGRQWTSREEVPLPAGERILDSTSSALVKHEGRLTWVTVLGGPGAVLEYQRVDDQWRHRRIADSGVEAVALAAGRERLWLALSGLDPGISGPTKSVRLLQRDTTWTLVSRDPTAEPYTEINHPSIAVLTGGVTLTWRELRGEGVAMARVGISDGSPGTLIQLDASASVVRLVAMPDGEPAWVLRHVGAIPALSELRLVRATEGSPSVARAILYPYTGYYAALAAGPDEVLVTGSEFDPDPARPTVRSLTLRLSPSCQ